MDGPRHRRRVFWSTAERRQLAVAGVALLAGLLLYLGDRSPTDIYLLRPGMAFGLPTGPLFGSLAANLPSFLHVLAFSLATAAVVPKPTNTTAIVLAWLIVDCAFEIAQLPLIATHVASVLPDWFARVPVLENISPYLLQGTFDTGDLSFTVLGAIVAYWILSMPPRELSDRKGEHHHG